ncbi:cell division protein ZapA [Altererythrobacter atlanticus]|uniref:Cell division protein ZapA n=1 Tax=Croceibacterium atlanticum TaxID=1267766 RepID=A0A0F7KQQ0_9SPHN|nr:cell division protein ZapA [Croceibacterium atlanticum]AKH41416.1 Cell division protein ZapA [Croceibacterium atlanticum]MBB5732878.1 cell division protein ZapA [Croceibacterium atlanticum]
MSNVTLEIGGRRLSVACGEGEEAHIAALGRMIDGKVSGLPNLPAQSEARILLYAALLLADEIHELRNAAAPQGGIDAAPLVALAEKLESLASRLEGAGPSS